MDLIAGSCPVRLGYLNCVVKRVDAPFDATSRNPRRRWPSRHVLSSCAAIVFSVGRNSDLDLIAADAGAFAFCD